VSDVVVKHKTYIDGCKSSGGRKA